MSTGILTKIIPEIDGVPHRLGRHVQHDERSKLHPFIPEITAQRTVIWSHHGTVLNQGKLGSCTGNAMTQCLVSGPLNDPKWTASEKKALQIYELATTLDDVPGSYPPDDTGSSGLGVSKAAMQILFNGKPLIRSYQHSFGIDAAKKTILNTPFISGTNWYESMFNPNASGLITISGQIAGGHEYLVLGYDPIHDLWTMLNSWGKKWSLAGIFHMSGADFARLLSEQGDITVPIR